jgi:hypothetical protein
MARTQQQRREETVGRLVVEGAIGLLERDNDKRRNKVDLQQELEDDRPKCPRVP